MNMDTRFRAQLKRQLGFLERSCAAFDAGYTDESTRIAVVTRVLMHDTRSSTSLLTHLQSRAITLLSTSMDIVAHFDNHPWFAKGQLPIFFDGMGSFADGRHRPKLGDSHVQDFRAVESWWLQPVIILQRVPYTRASITLALANKDGGAHVDAALTPEYECLIAPGSLGTIVQQIPDGEELAEPIVDAHFCTLRQIGYELLNSPELLALAKDASPDITSPAT